MKRWKAQFPASVEMKKEKSQESVSPDTPKMVLTIVKALIMHDWVAGGVGEINSVDLGEMLGDDVGDAESPHLISATGSIVDAEDTLYEEGDEALCTSVTHFIRK